MIRLLNSDWNDCIYWIVQNVPYPEMYLQAESHLNTAQACLVLLKLAEIIRKQLEHLPNTLHQRAVTLTNAMDAYRGELLNALMTAWGDRTYLARVIYPGGVLGANQMWLEPQAFAVGIADVAKEKRRQMLREVMGKLADPEPWGVRQQEAPVAIVPGYPGGRILTAGGRENGGVWFALVGQLIVSAVDVDKDIGPETSAQVHTRRACAPVP